MLRGNANFDDESIKNEIAVMKVLVSPCLFLRRIRIEFMLHLPLGQVINHPHCVNLVEVLEDQEAVHIIQELAAGGEHASPKGPLARLE